MLALRRCHGNLYVNGLGMQQSSSNPTRRGNKRGSSAAQTMLASRAAQLDAEQETTWNPSVWREMYALMRCPGPPCNHCPYCWRHLFDKTHYKLRTHHLKALISFVEEGNIQFSEPMMTSLTTSVRNYSRKNVSGLRDCPNQPAPHQAFCPLNITNVLPQSPLFSYA